MSILTTLSPNLPEHSQVFSGLRRIDKGLFLVHQLLAVTMVTLYRHARAVIPIPGAGSVAIVSRGRATRQRQQHEGSTAD